MTKIILVRPQLPENIGMVARAMLNFGFDQLRLVDPREGWPHADAYPASAGADTVLDQTTVYKTVAEAVADLSVVYATTARKRDMVKPVIDLPQLAPNHEHNIGILFGAEASGLSNQELILADQLITIPTNPTFSSMNLAQTVILVCHHLYQRPQSCAKETLPASKKELVFLLGQLEQMLDQRDFFKPAGKKPLMLQNLQNIFTRTGLSSQEVQTLHGVFKALMKKG